jgi:CarD family transcriptional regulator, regulator of rRNA transcription
MVARTKSKKTTSSKTKKAGAASTAKTRAKRTTKAASSSSVRTRATKSKTASNTRVARKTSKTVRAKTKNVATKLAKRKRTSPNGKPLTRESAAAKRPAGAASRKVAASKSPSKTTRAAAAAKRALAIRAQLKEQEAKLSRASRIAPEAKAVTEKVSAPIGGSKPSSPHAPHVAHSTDTVTPAKAAAPVVKVQKPVVSEEVPAVAKTLKSASQRQGFRLNEFVVYPAHGVGQIVSIEEQEVAGFKLELFVISFSKDKLTLRVPTSKVTGVGMRKISDPDAARRSLDILTGRARVKRTMWSRRAQEYETKINSGDINAIAEVVRDLYRSEAQPEQSYSERQLYEAALDRMVREIAAVQKSNEIDALKAVEAQLQKGQSRAAKALGPPSATGEIEEQAA